MSDEKFKRKVQFNIPESMQAAVQSYMEVHGIESVTQAVKGLMIEALAVTPKDGATIAACRRAFIGVQQVLLESTGRFYAEMGKDTERMIAEITASRSYCPHCNNQL